MAFYRGAHYVPSAVPKWVLPAVGGIASVALALGAVFLIGWHLRHGAKPTDMPASSFAPPVAEITQTEPSATEPITEPTVTATAAATTAVTTTKGSTTTQRTVTGKKTIPSVKPPSIVVESGNITEDIPKVTIPPRATNGYQDYTPVRPDRVCLQDLPPLYNAANKPVGIDVSRHNGEIDWAAVKAAGIQFAMIRCGYRTTVSGTVYEDANYRKNMQGALEAGVPVGVYFFSAAKTRAEALEEAAFVLEVIKGYHVTWPVAFDFEIFNQDRLEGVDNTTITDNAIAFMDYVAQEGYTPMLYSSRNMFWEQWETARLGQYRLWMAQYAEFSVKNYGGVHAIWQCASDGLVPGIDTHVDLNIAYEDLSKQHTALLSENTTDIVLPDMYEFVDCYDEVKINTATVLRTYPASRAPNILHHALVGTQLIRTGIDSKNGLDRLLWNGRTVYVESAYVTYVAPATTTTTTTTTAAATTSAADADTTTSTAGTASETSADWKGGEEAVK